MSRHRANERGRRISSLAVAVILGVLLLLGGACAILGGIATGIRIFS